MTLFTLESLCERLVVPKGVERRSIDEIRPGLSVKIREHSPQTAADFVKILLLKNYDAVWVDADVYCLKPFKKKLSYIFAPDHDETIEGLKQGRIHTAVLALPKDSEALDLSAQYVNASLGYQSVQNAVIAAYFEAQKRNPMLNDGRSSLTFFLEKTGELTHQLPSSVLYPIHYGLGDCYWDPFADFSKRFKGDTLSTHIWASKIRPIWYESRALRGSFMWKAARELNVNMEKLRLAR